MTTTTQQITGTVTRHWDSRQYYLLLTVGSEQRILAGTVANARWLLERINRDRKSAGQPEIVVSVWPTETHI